jgi:D-sedoheptulose 7-phosphate isomerase
MENYLQTYKLKLVESLNLLDFQKIDLLIRLIKKTWKKSGVVYLCGNGGSAANAIHLANDFLYGVGKKKGIGIKVEALSANSSVITCLANDISFDYIFSEQIRVKGTKNDILIPLSGSGNSKNIILAIKMAQRKNMSVFPILGYDGGKCKKISKNYIHVPIKDMQISEDIQLIVGHICMQKLSKMI